MFGKTIRLFKLFGFDVKIDISWLILAILITWSLANGLFPYYFEGLSTATYIGMGIAGAIGLFLSIVFHEFSHSIAARQSGIPMSGITLFIFGGVAEMNDEPRNPRSEFWMAIAGPAASLIIGGVFYLFYWLGQNLAWGDPVQGVLVYLALINVVLAGFNLIPAYPLDGGRVLRSIIWGMKNDILQATRTSSKIGSGFGIALMVLGGITFLMGNFIGGIWWVLIGMFVRNASQQSYNRIVLRKELEGASVERFMKSNPVTVPPDETLDNLVNDYIYKYHFKMLPVVEGSGLKGCVRLEQLKHIPKQEWNELTAGRIAEECNEKNTIDANTDAVKALSMMRNSGTSKMIVTKNGEMAGIITLHDLMEFISNKMELEHRAR